MSLLQVAQVVVAERPLFNRELALGQRLAIGRTLPQDRADQLGALERDRQPPIQPPAEELLTPISPVDWKAA